MNIDSNMGVLLYSNDSGGAAAISGLGGITNGKGNLEGSAFQKVISQMLLAKNQTAEAVGANANSGPIKKSNENFDLVSDLLLAGGNLSKLRLQNNDLADNTVISSGQAGESEKTDENDPVMAALQILMAGLGGGQSIADTEKVSQAVPDGTLAADRSVTSLSSAKDAVADISVASSLESNTDSKQVTGQAKPIISAGGTIEPEQILQTSAEKNVDSVIAQTVQMDQANPAQKIIEEKTSDLKTADSSQTVTPNPTGKNAGYQETVYSGQTKESEIKNNLETAYVAPLAQDKQADDGGESEKADKASSAASEHVQSGDLIQNIAANEKIPETTQTTGPADQIEPYSQIKDEIMTKLEQKGPTEFKMQLEPEDLGQIDVNLKLSEGKLTIDILAANSKTHALLTSQVDKLISSMGLQNVQVESVQVNQQMNSQSQNNSQSQTYTANPSMDFSDKNQSSHEEAQWRQISSGIFGTQTEATADNISGSINSNKINSNFYKLDYVV